MSISGVVSTGACEATVVATPDAVGEVDSPDDIESVAAVTKAATTATHLMVRPRAEEACATSVTLVSARWFRLTEPPRGEDDEA